MAERTNGAIHIGQLNLRIPGDGADAARRVSDGVARGLAQKVPIGTRRRIGALSVRVQAPADATEAEVSDAVAEAITRSLRK